MISEAENKLLTFVCFNLILLDFKISNKFFWKIIFPLTLSKILTIPFLLTRTTVFLFIIGRISELLVFDQIFFPVSISTLSIEPKLDDRKSLLFSITRSDSSKKDTSL